MASFRLEHGARAGDHASSGDQFHDNRDPMLFSWSTLSGITKCSTVSDLLGYVLRMMYAKFEISPLSVCLAPQLVPGLSNRDSVVDVLRPTRCVISVKRTVSMSMDFRKLGTSEDYSTF